MQKTNIAFGSVFALIGAVFCVASVRYGIAPPTSDGVPGAGFFPFIVSSLVVILGVALVIQALLHAGVRPSPFHMDTEQKANLLPLCLTVVGIFGLFALWSVLPFQWASFIFCLFLNRVYRRSWRFTIIFSVVFVFSIYFLFNRLLFVQFEI